MLNGISDFVQMDVFRTFANKKNDYDPKGSNS